MKITGERPVDGVTPDGLVALHTGGYQEIRSRLTGGAVLDLGCGVGFGSSQLIRPDTEVFGIDYDIEAASMAHKRWAEQGLRVACMDGGRLGFVDGAFDAVCSSHIIEHFADPGFHVAEIARVLRDDGTAFILTPNEPADLENPFHVHLFRADSLRALLDRHFEDVWVGGHDARQHVKDDFAARRKSASRLLKLDFLDLRHRIPRKWYIAAYSTATRMFYRVQAGRHAGGATNITPEDFFVTDTVDDTTLSLLAVARRPRRPSASSA